MLKTKLCITGINYILNSNNISPILLYFDQINATLESRRDIQKHIYIYIYMNDLSQ